MLTDSDSVDYDDDDRDAPLESDLEGSDDDHDDDDMVCPACGKGVAVDTPKCPHCGDWIRPVTQTGGMYSRKTKIIVLLMFGLGLLPLVLSALQYLFRRG